MIVFVRILLCIWLLFSLFVTMYREYFISLLTYAHRLTAIIIACSPAPARVGTRKANWDERNIGERLVQRTKRWTRQMHWLKRNMHHQQISIINSYLDAKSISCSALNDSLQIDKTTALIFQSHKTEGIDCVLIVFYLLLSPISLYV